MEKSNPIVDEIFADLNYAIQNEIIKHLTCPDIVVEGTIIEDGEYNENSEER